MRLILALLALAILLTFYFLLVLVGTILTLLPWLIVGLIAGSVAGAITKSRHGVMGDIAIGLVGSVIGGVLYEAIARHSAGGPFSPSRLVAAIIGSVLLLMVIKVTSRKT